MIYRENFTIREILVSLCFWRFINNVIDLPPLLRLADYYYFIRVYISFNVHAYVQARTPAEYAGRHVICPCPISLVLSFYFILPCPISVAAAPSFYNDVDPMTLNPVVIVESPLAARIPETTTRPMFLRPVFTAFIFF